MRGKTYKHPFISPRTAIRREGERISTVEGDRHPRIGRSADLGRWGRAGTTLERRWIRAGGALGLRQIHVGNMLIRARSRRFSAGNAPSARKVRPLSWFQRARATTIASPLEGRHDEAPSPRAPTLNGNAARKQEECPVPAGTGRPSCATSSTPRRANSSAIF